MSSFRKMLTCYIRNLVVPKKKKHMEMWVSFFDWFSLLGSLLANSITASVLPHVHRSQVPPERTAGKHNSDLSIIWQSMTERSEVKPSLLMGERCWETGGFVGPEKLDKTELNTLDVTPISSLYVKLTQETAGCSYLLYNKNNKWINIFILLFYFK